MLPSEEDALRYYCYAHVADDAPWAALEDFLRERQRYRQADTLWYVRQCILELLPVALPIAERID